MCIKEMAWELESATQLRRATILALAQFLRKEMLQDMGISDAALDSPFDYSRNDLWSINDSLDTLRHENKLRLDATIKDSRKVGLELPQFAIDHAKLTSRAIEI